MADATVKRLDQMEGLFDGFLVLARSELGVTSFGMQVYRYPAHADFQPAHNHAGSPADDGQEEVYTVLNGRAVLRIGDESHELVPGVFARVGPGEMRQIVTEDEPAAVLVIGATPGEAFTPSPVTEVGVSEDEVQALRVR